MRRSRWLLEPSIAVVAFTAWWGLSAAPIANYVPMREDMSTTNPYAALIAALLAGAIAITRLSPIFSVGLVGLAIAAQLIGWASRFSQTAWTAYLMLVIVGVLLAIHARGSARRASLLAAPLVVVAVAALLTLPAFSLSGEFGLINGKPTGNSETWTSFTLVVVASLGVVGLVSILSDRVVNARGKAGADLAPLSERERDIYLWVAEGKTNREIAAAAFIEESTVKSHVGNILIKLGLTSRAGIIAHAYRTGTLAPSGRAPGESLRPSRTPDPSAPNGTRARLPR
jgi:DNA-binding CsgD family transcriptional regulator